MEVVARELRSRGGINAVVERGLYLLGGLAEWIGPPFDGSRLVDCVIDDARVRSTWHGRSYRRADGRRGFWLPWARRRRIVLKLPAEHGHRARKGQSRNRRGLGVAGAFPATCSAIC